MKSLIQVQRCQPCLGTYVQISIRAKDEATIQSAFTAAFKRIALIHDLMSFHDSQSEVSLLNREAFNHPIQVSPELWCVLKQALFLSRISDGVFDITVANHLQKWGFLPFVGNQDAKFQSASYRDIRLLRNRFVSFQKPLLIDLGGIAKGFAVDEAVAVLKENGIREGAVNAGGDLRVFGKEQWPVAVRHPRFPYRAVQIGRLASGSVATSGAYFAKRRRHKKWVSPIFDSKSNRTFNKRHSVSVISDTCIVADALTKIVALSPEKSPSILNRFRSKAFITKFDGSFVGLN